ncbi:SGNH/GDSL hydrolase family protein [Streptomyces sp. NPDC051064]|uniref:SGNH/GDSL hydrolase family protein n=1 Tax=Streptomyces sp. NPDC051064 TaxID=3365641 RepID=UPI0037B4C37D
MSGAVTPGAAATAGGRATPPGAPAPPTPVGARLPAPRTNAPARTTHAPATVRFAALGDSLTECIGDPFQGGWRGWAALLAEGLGGTERDVEFRNLAVAGALSADVHERQAEAAADFRPDIASVVVGVNDTLRRSFDIRRLTGRLDEVCALLAGGGAVLLTACLPDPGTALGLPGPLRRPLARRQQAVNAVVHDLSARYDAVHLHASDRAWTDDRSLWSVERLHPGERGHRRLAAGFHGMLAERGLALGDRPGQEPQQPPPSRAAGALWLATKGTGWLARRSTDLLPQLLGLAMAEVGHRARGTSERLDARAEQALREALSDVAGHGSDVKGGPGRAFTVHGSRWGPARARPHGDIRR